jgi:uncharacterized protein (DUF58 family)
MNAAQEPPSTPAESEVIDAVSALTIEVRRVVEGLQGGGHASLHLGASIEFAEHKKYSPGDDIRNIDWRALARTDRYFVKTYEREVTLRCLMLIDCSASMGYRGTRADYSKLRYAELLLGAMAHVLVRQGDAVGLLPFAGRPLDYLPPQRRPEHLPRVMSKLAVLSAAEEGDTGFGVAIRHAAERAGRRAMIVLATDLWGAGRETEIALKSLAARGHDVVLFYVLSPDEVDLPFERATTFTGLEGEGDVDVDPALIREDYRHAVMQVRDRWRRVSGEAGIDLVHAITRATPLAVLGEFAARRHRAAGGVRR